MLNYQCYLEENPYLNYQYKSAKLTKDKIRKLKFDPLSQILYLGWHIKCSGWVGLIIDYWPVLSVWV